MAVATVTDQSSSIMAITQYDHDPDGTSAVDVAWVDMRDYGRFIASFFRTVGTSALTYKILANSASDGSGSDVEIKAGSAAPDAVGDYAFLECTAEELLSAGSDLRYVTLNLTFATATDEGVVTYVRSMPRHATSSLTSDSIA